MENQRSQQYWKQLNEKIQAQYYHQFTALFQSSTEVLVIENQLLFFSYCLSEIVQDFIEKNCHALKIEHPQYSCEVLIAQITKIVLQAEEVQFLIGKLEQQSELKEERKIQKDRKTSFFRTVLKHIKSLKKEIRGKHKIIHSDILTEIQLKLSKNTISASSIEKLFDSYGNVIVEYLSSTQIYKDILNINKSKTNKAFYLLHLREIAAEANKGRLSEYPFFSRLSFKDKIKSIVQTCASSLMEGEKREKKQGNEQKKAGEEGMIALEISDELQLESLVEYCYYKSQQSPKTEHMLSEVQIGLWMGVPQRLENLEECCWGGNDFIRY